MLRWLRHRVPGGGNAPTAPPPPIPPSLPAEQVSYDAAARFLDVQISTDDVLDQEARGVLTIGSTVLPLTFGLLNLGPNRAPDLAIACFAVALVAYAILLSCSFRISRFRGLEYRPHLPTLMEHSRNYDGDLLRQWVAEEYVASSEKNRPVLERKARWSGVAFLALYVEVFLLGGRRAAGPIVTRRPSAPGGSWTIER
jgi:hypothetical protein